MLNNGGFTHPCNSQNHLTTVCGGSASFVNKPHLFLVPKPSPSSSLHCKTASLSSQFRRTHLRFCAVRGQRRGGLCVFSQKMGNESSGEVGVDDFDDFDDDEDFDDFDDGEDEDEDEDEEDDEDVGEVMPFRRMQKWLTNKPRGFGEGKVYDTSVEEKLAKELEQSRRAQAINIRNLKLNPVDPNSKKGDKKKKKKETGETPSGIRVRVSNLPKKRNIQRDLVSAFKGFAGMLDITPVVSGSKKTRDPVCKGYAFIGFKSENDASRFIETFSTQTITFGKVQKQVKYEMMGSCSSEKSSNATESAPGKRLVVLEKPRDAEFVTAQAEDIEEDDDDLVVAAREDSEEDGLATAEMEDSEDDDDMLAAWEDSEEDEFATAEMEDDEDDEFLTAETEAIEAPADLSSSDVEDDDSEEATRERIKLLEQNLFAGMRGEKVPKLEIQGSAKLLKIKEEVSPLDFSEMQERAKPKEKNQNVAAKGRKGPVSAKRLKRRDKSVLNEVFTKYGAKAKGSLASKKK